MAEHTDRSERTIFVAAIVTAALIAVLGAILLVWAISEPGRQGLWDLLGPIMCIGVAAIALWEIRRSFSGEHKADGARGRPRPASYYALCGLAGLGAGGGIVVIVVGALQYDTTAATYAFGLLLIALSGVMFLQLRRRYGNRNPTSP